MSERSNIVRRKLGGRGMVHVGNISLLFPQKKQHLAESHRLTSDTASDRPLHGRPLENTYQLDPDESDRFQAHRVEKLLKDILESRLKDMEYDRETCNSKAKELVSEFHARVKDFQWRRYKLVCHITIGQSLGQGIQVASRCVWDTRLDNQACAHYSNRSLFAVAQCYGIYFE